MPALSCAVVRCTEMASIAFMAPQAMGASFECSLWCAAPEADVRPQVTLLYAVNYTAEQLVPMAPSPGGVPGTYQASIPAGVTDPGTMVRWAIQARGARA